MGRAKIEAYQREMKGKKIKPAPNWTSSSYKRRPGKKRMSRYIQ
jgi:hypothetical protein